MSTERYVVEIITQPGTYYDRTGRWQVRDSENPQIGAFATGHERQMKRWARELNVREAT